MSSPTLMLPEMCHVVVQFLKALPPNAYCVQTFSLIPLEISLLLLFSTRFIMVSPSETSSQGKAVFYRAIPLRSIAYSDV